MRLLIKGGRLVDPFQGIDGVRDILIEEDRIGRVAREIPKEGAEVIEAQGLVVTPGLIDLHTHLREPGWEYKETIRTGTRAAIKGGFTSIVCMPDTYPGVDNKAVVDFITSKAKEEGKCEVYCVGSISKGLKGEELSEVGDLKEAGVVALSDDGYPVMNGELMRRALEYSRMFNLPLISHCEDLNLSNEGQINEGYISMVLGLKGIPKAAEEIMVAREIILAELTKGQVHIAHVSTAGSVELIRGAKRKGLKVTAETAPHYFTLTEEDLRDYNTTLKVNPPLRTKEDVKAIKEGLQDGTIDCIATDHSPQTSLEKDVEFNLASFGMVGLETALSLVITELVLTGTLTLMEAIAKLTLNPAQILRLPFKGLKEGSKADITIIDLDREEIVDKNKFESKGKNSPFHGWKLKGTPLFTILGGKVVMREGRIIG